MTTSSVLGLHAAGWGAGTAFVLVTGVLLTRGLRRAGQGSLGPADQVTLTRAGLVGVVTALVADSFTGAIPVSVLVALAAVALLLDAVDGQVARRTRTESAFGARFDMEVDAFLILVLSVFVAGRLGPWVLLIGGMRYAFLAASQVLPWLNAALPPRLSRKAVAAVQGIVLAVASSDLLTTGPAALAVGTALGLLVWSFGRDIGWLSAANRAANRAAANRTVALRLVAGVVPAAVRTPGDVADQRGQDDREAADADHGQRVHVRAVAAGTH